MARADENLPQVLAFDGGSTKTEAVLVDRGGRVLGRARVGPSNHQFVGLDGMVEALSQAVAAVWADSASNGLRTGSPMPDPTCPMGVYCLAGIDLPVDVEKVAPAIAEQRWTDDSVVWNDTFAVSRAGTSTEWGIGLVCGTGMNCAATGPDGRTVRFPALAELSGDFAPGGAWLGLRALGLALRANDGRGPATSLSERVAAHFGQPDAESVLSSVYTGAIAYGRLFELAPILLDAAAAGDAPAREAANFLADEIAAFVRAAVNRLALRDHEVEIVLGGGVFETDDDGFHARVADGIRAAAPRARLIRLTAPPVLGAALLGLDACGAPAVAKDALRAQLSPAQPVAPAPARHRRGR